MAWSMASSILLLSVGLSLELILSSRTPALVIGDGDLALLSGSFVLSRDIQDTIGIDIKTNSDLRHSSWGRRDTRQLKFT
ncbi:Glutamate dehydrogenase, NAD-specific [Dillenia turbinata]|uniref:Glutamate dehydrogenase, NAD-specific n=1 Tax=Dillenia turbinata TaxID=194707 RepID=A0AAN8VKQ1_9MAGN